MCITEYKESIKKLVDNTESEALLKAWKFQLERDTKESLEAAFTEDEWNLVQEGPAEYGNNEMISFEEFISKRK